MFFQIWRKEYLKLNKALFALLLVHIGVAVYHYLRIRNAFIVNEPVLLWSDIIEKGGIFFSRFEKPLYLSSVILAVLQFYPETDKRRLRISCHLPMNEQVMLWGMLAFSILTVTIYWFLDLAAACLTGLRYFPYDVYSQQPLIMFYWYIKALVFYAVSAVLTLELSWGDKFRRGIMLAGFYNLINMSVYNSPLIYLIPLILTALIFIPAVYYPALRFREGGDV
ncbi:MAG: hypothetical protein LBD73_01125 [Deferribacteraceae bacterium]|nr:hypothetical protein [Deferribacteraceae bacterium]